MGVSDDVALVAADHPGRLGVYARNLSTGEVVGLDADRVVATESAAKTAVLVHFEREALAGRVDPKRRVPVGFRHVDGSGVLRHLDDGLTLTLDDLACLMIIVSDNVATATLVDVLGGPDPINATARQLGCETTRWVGSPTLAQAARGELVSQSSLRDLAELYAHLGDRSRRVLFRQQFQAGLPSRLPHDPYAADVGVEMPVRVYNKTGLGFGRFVDSALIETSEVAWVVAAAAEWDDDPDGAAHDMALDAFGRIGEVLYDAWAVADS